VLIISSDYYNLPSGSKRDKTVLFCLFFIFIFYSELRKDKTHAANEMDQSIIGNILAIAG
jgi:hypothetical protein